MLSIVTGIYVSIATAREAFSGLLVQESISEISHYKCALIPSYISTVQFYRFLTSQNYQGCQASRLSSDEIRICRPNLLLRTPPDTDEVLVTCSQIRGDEDDLLTSWQAATS